MSILAIFYSEFDNIVGPKILYQTPESYPTQEIFDSISDYVITGKELCGKIVSIAISGVQVVGYPISIENEKYDRNTLSFNVSFVLPKDIDKEPYECVVRKLAIVLHRVECESEFLFQHEKKVRLSKILPKIMYDLNTEGECTLPLDEANMLSLKVFASVNDPPLVQDYHVPVFLRPPEILMRLDLDLALTQVIPHIDGIKFAKKIGIDAEMEMACVKKTLRILLYYGFIALVDTFKFSNEYRIGPNLNDIFNDQKLQDACCKFISLSVDTIIPITTALRIYSDFRPGLKVEKVVINYPKEMKMIDIRSFITFGIIHGLIERVYRYPILIRTSVANLKTHGHHHNIGPVNEKSYHHKQTQQYKTQNLQSYQSFSNQNIRQKMIKMMDGTNKMEEICVAFMKPFQTIEEIVLNRDDTNQIIYVSK